MKRNVSGFTLLELIVATLIASLLSAVLLTALSQSTRVQTSVDTTVDMSERIGIVVSQFEKDLAGAFVPVQAEKSDIAEAMQEKSDEGQKSSSTTADKTSEKKGEAKKPKPIEKIFYGTNKDGMLDTLTFITNNPLVVFVGKDVGTVKPKVVRVQYTLKPDPENKNSFTLFRQESNELDLAEYKNVRPYEVIGGIKKLSATYTARIEKKSDSASSSAESPGGHGKAMSDKKAKKPKKVYEYKVQPDWISEKKEEKKKVDQKGEKEEPEFPRIPYSVEFKMTLWDKQNKKDKDFTFVCAIPVDSIEAQQQDEESPRESTKKEKPQIAEPGDTSKPQSGQPGQNVTVGQRVRSEVVVYDESIEALNKAMGSLKNLLGRV